MPPTYVYAEIRTSNGFASLVASHPHWLLKTSAHRGQGLKLVSAPALLAASQSRSSTTGGGGGGGGSIADDVGSIRAWLREHTSTALLQLPIDRPMLIGGCKFSVRLYALATSALPLRVYVHEEGFALFASHPYNDTSMADDPLAFLTNAHVNAHHPTGGVDAAAEQGASAGGHGDAKGAGAGTGGHHSMASRDLAVDQHVASSLGLTLPPATQRWALSDLITFIEARDAYVQAREHRRSLVGRGGALAQRWRRARHDASVGGGGVHEPSGALLRGLHRLVLLTFLAAQSPLSRAARESLGRLGLSGAHEWAATFELAAVDLMLDSERAPWLLEVTAHGAHTHASHPSLARMPALATAPAHTLLTVACVLCVVKVNTSPSLKEEEEVCQRQPNRTPRLPSIHRQICMA